MGSVDHGTFLPRTLTTGQVVRPVWLAFGDEPEISTGSTGFPQWSAEADHTISCDSVRSGVGVGLRVSGAGEQAPCTRLEPDPAGRRHPAPRSQQPSTTCTEVRTDEEYYS